MELCNVQCPSGPGRADIVQYVFVLCFHRYDDCCKCSNPRRRNGTDCPKNAPASQAGDTSTDLPQGPNPQTILYISLSFAVSLAITCWVFFRVSGGQFNPAVTLGLCLIGAITWTRGCLIFPAQLAGAISAACVVKWLYFGPLAVTTSVAADTTIAQGLFIEMFLTALLVFSVMMLAAERHKTTFLAPIGIGMALFVAELAGVCKLAPLSDGAPPRVSMLTLPDYTGGSLNPARSFGPCVATMSFRGEHWIYWAGPCLGAVVASGLFKFLKSMKYDSANPCQVLDTHELNAKILDEKLEQIARPLSSVATVVGAHQDFAWDTPTKDNQSEYRSEYTVSPKAQSQSLNVPRESMQSVRRVRMSDDPQPPPTPTPAYKGRPCTQCGSH